MPRPPSSFDVARSAASAGLALILATGALPAPVGAVAGPAIVSGSSIAADGALEAVAVAADPEAGPTTDATDDATAPEQRPSIAYEEAMAHANDVIEFQPGGRVTAGFKPRAGDAWPIDNRPPSALPGGRATGREMAASPQGSRWATVRGSTPPAKAGHANAAPDEGGAPVDASGGTRSIAATGASYITGAAATSVEPAAASGLRRQVFGFLPYWELSGAGSKVNTDVLSTIAYFSVGADRDGNLKKKDPDGTRTTGWGGWTSSAMTSVISNAHRHGTRVVLTVSVFAWTTAQANTQRAILGSKAARLRLVKQVVAAVRDRGADGVNLDFEPLASGYADEFVALLKTFRTQFNRIRRGYQITYDTTGFIGNYPLEASVGKGAADAIFVMGYDYRTSSSGTAGSIDPLSGPGYDLADTVRAYTARVSPSRIILGLPWYGRAWSTSDDGPRSRTLSGAKYGYSAAVNYESVVGLVAKYGRRWDPLERSPYVVYRRQNCTSTYGCVTSWRQVYYDDGASLKLRFGIVNDYGLRGAGMWALGYDGGHAELYRAVSDSFLVDKSAPQAGIRMLASTQADEGFVVSWPARDTSRIVSYDVQVSVDGGPWAAWLTKTRATSNVWLGADGHGYAFRVRAVDSKGNAGSWNVGSRWDGSPSLVPGGFGRVVADGLAYRSGPHTSSVKLGTLKADTIVAITRGPVSSDGYAWYEVTEPIREWSPVSFAERGVWIAARSSSDTNVKPYRAPNSTIVDAGIRGLAFGPGPASGVGSAPSAIAIRAFSPNRDGWEDSLRLRWTNTVKLDDLTLKVYRTDGRLVGLAERAGRRLGSPVVGLERRRRRVDGPERPLRPPARRHRRLADVPCAVEPPGDERAGRGVRRQRRHGCPEDHLRIGVEHADLAQRRRRPRIGEARHGVGRGHPLGAPDRVGGYGHRAQRGRHRRFDRVHLARREERRRTRAQRPLHGDAVGHRRRRQPGAAVVHDHPGHHRADGVDRDRTGRVLAQRRRRARRHADCLDGERARDGQRPDPQGQHGRPELVREGSLELGGHLGRARRRRQAGRRRPLRGTRLRRRRGRQPPRHEPRRGCRSHRRLPALVARVLSPGRRRPRADLDAELQAHPRRDDVPAPVQRGRSTGADDLDGPDAACG